MVEVEHLYTPFGAHRIRRRVIFAHIARAPETARGHGKGVDIPHAGIRVILKGVIEKLLQRARIGPGVKAFDIKRIRHLADRRCLAGGHIAPGVIDAALQDHIVIDRLVALRLDLVNDPLTAHRCKAAAAHRSVFYLHAVLLGNAAGKCQPFAVIPLPPADGIPTKQGGFSVQRTARIGCRHRRRRSRQQRSTDPQSQQAQNSFPDLHSVFLLFRVNNHAQKKRTCIFCPSMLIS